MMAASESPSKSSRLCGWVGRVKAVRGTDLIRLTECNEEQDLRGWNGLSQGTIVVMPSFFSECFISHLSIVSVLASCASFAFCDESDS